VIAISFWAERPQAPQGASENIFCYGNIPGRACHALKTAPQKEASEQVSAVLKEKTSLFNLP